MSRLGHLAGAGLIGVGALLNAAAGQVSIYPTPPLGNGVQASTLHDVRINGQPAFVYGVNVNNTVNYQDVGSPASMLPFGLHGGSATVEVTLRSGQANNAVVRAQSHNIVPTINGNRVTFTLNQPGNYSVEINGRTQPLFLFANPPEVNPPTGPSGNVIYFGPGVHNPGQITVNSNQTVYLAPGSFVNGFISSTNANNVTIRGRGVLHGGGYAQGEIGQKFIQLRNGNGALIEGIIALNSPEWNLNPDNQRNVTIDNFKTIGHRRNSDSIDPVNANGLVIRNSFLRGHDDGVTLKGRAGGAYNNNPNIRNVLVENMTIWNQWMRALVVGGELHGIQNVENVRFRNLDIIYSGHNPQSGAQSVDHPAYHARNRDAAMSVWNVDDAHVRDVVFENIRVEHADRLVRLSILENQFSNSLTRGRVSNVTFRDIQSGTGANVIDITGHSRNHQVRDVTFENLRIGGQQVRGPDDVRYVSNAHTRNVRFVWDLQTTTVIFTDPFDPYDPSESFSSRYNTSAGRTGTLALLNDGGGNPRHGVRVPIAAGGSEPERGRWDAGGNSNIASRTWNESIGTFTDHETFQVSAHFLYVAANNANVNLAGVGIANSDTGVLASTGPRSGFEAELRSDAETTGTNAVLRLTNLVNGSVQQRVRDNALQFALSDNTWYQLVMNVTRKSDGLFDVGASVFGRGTGGLADPVLLASMDLTNVANGGITALTNLYAGFGLYSRSSTEHGMQAVDQFRVLGITVIPEPAAMLPLAALATLLVRRRTRLDRSPSCKNTRVDAVRSSRVPAPATPCSL